MRVESVDPAGIASHVTRRIAIGSKSLVVLDGLFSPSAVASLFQFLERVPYRLNDFDSTETAYARHWKADLPVDLPSAMPELGTCLRIARETFRSDALTLQRLHANLHLFGDAQFPHTDLSGGVTALYYANPEWREDEFGETVFYDDAREPSWTVAPRPGRLAVFDADIVHRAGVPSRACYAPRISVAFKFVRTRPAGADGTT